MGLNERVPIDLTWETSIQCYLRCKHCSAMPTHPLSNCARKKMISNQSVVAYMRENPVRSIELTGGEPLIHPYDREWWKEQSFHIMNEEIVERFIIHTSGIVMDEDRRMNFLKLDPLWRGTCFQFSVHSHDERTHDLMTGVDGSFRLMMRSLNSALDHNLEVEINIVPTLLNIDGISKTIAEFSPQKINILRLLKHGYAQDCWDSLYPGDIGSDLHSRFDDHPNVRMSRSFDGNCGAGVDKLYIRSDEEVFSCVAMKHVKFSYTQYDGRTIKEHIDMISGKFDGCKCCHLAG